MRLCEGTLTMTIVSEHICKETRDLEEFVLKKFEVEKKSPEEADQKVQKIEIM